MGTCSSKQGIQAYVANPRRMPRAVSQKKITRDLQNHLADLTAFIDSESQALEAKSPQPACITESTDQSGSEGSNHTNSSPQTVETQSSSAFDMRASISTIGVTNTSRARNKAFNDSLLSTTSETPDPVIEASYHGTFQRVNSADYDEETYFSEEEITLNTTSGGLTGEHDSYDEMTIDSKSYTEYTIQDEMEDASVHEEEEDSVHEEAVKAPEPPPPTVPAPSPSPPEEAGVYIEVKTSKASNENSMSFDWSRVPELGASRSYEQQASAYNFTRSNSNLSSHHSRGLFDPLPKPEVQKGNIPWLGATQHRLLGASSFDTMESGNSTCSDLTSNTEALRSPDSSQQHLSKAYSSSSHSRLNSMLLSPVSSDDTSVGDGTSRVNTSSSSDSVYEEYTITDACSVYEVVTVDGVNDQVLHVADLDLSNKSDLLGDQEETSESGKMEFDLSVLGDQTSEPQQTNTDDVAKEISSSDKDAVTPTENDAELNTKQAVASPEAKNSKASKWKDRLSKARQRRVSMIGEVCEKDGEDASNSSRDSKQTSQPCSEAVLQSPSTTATPVATAVESTEAPSTPPKRSLTETAKQVSGDDSSDDQQSSSQETSAAASYPCTPQRKADIKDKDGQPSQSLLPLSSNQVVASTLQTLPGTDIMESKPMIWATVSKSVVQTDDEDEEEFENSIDDHIGALLQKAQTSLLKKTLAVNCNVVLGVATSIASEARPFDGPSPNATAKKSKMIIVTLSGTPCRVMASVNASPVKVEAIPA